MTKTQYEEIEEASKLVSYGRNIGIIKPVIFKTVITILGALMEKVHR